MAIQPGTPTISHSIGQDLKSVLPPRIKSSDPLIDIISPLMTPQTRSYYGNVYTRIPDPPAEARMQLGVSTEADGSLFINYVVWDKESQRFMRKDIHYTSLKGVLLTVNVGDFQAKGGYIQKIKDGEVLYGGAIVDQQQKVIHLPNGQKIYGPTGDIYDAQGNLSKRLEA
jgi:hypothetical protein